MEILCFSIRRLLSVFNKIGLVLSTIYEKFFHLKVVPDTALINATYGKK